MKKVEVLYFASLREASGVENETVETEAATLGELYEELRRRYHFSLDAHSVRGAVGTDYVELDAHVEDGMTVTFIPPVAGG